MKSLQKKSTWHSPLNIVLALGIAVPHFIVYFILFGICYTYGDMGKATPPLLERSFYVLGFPGMPFGWYLLSLISKLCSWLEVPFFHSSDMSGLYIVFVLNSMLWGAFLTSIIRSIPNLIRRIFCNKSIEIKSNSVREIILMEGLRPFWEHGIMSNADNSFANTTGFLGKSR